VDDWLVHTVGLLATAIGIVLGIAPLGGKLVPSRRWASPRAPPWHSPE
jgi:hypothetical protein